MTSDLPDDPHYLIAMRLAQEALQAKGSSDTTAIAERALHYAIQRVELDVRRKALLRVRYQHRGFHTHCHVFVRSSLSETYAKTGDLVFTNAEWTDWVKNKLEAIGQVIPLDQ